MEFRLPFIQDIQRFQVKKPFYDENIIIFCNNYLVQSKPTLRTACFVNVSLIVWVTYS